jgi:hypothetical protein
MIGITTITTIATTIATTKTTIATIATTIATTITTTIIIISHITIIIITLITIIIINHNHHHHHREIDAELTKIDTSLSPDQTKYVEMLKKQIRGGVNSPRSIYREVPKSEEIEGEGNFMPKMAPNAEKLIDYALSFIPKRGGPRRSRHKKRMLARQNQRVANDARRIIQTRKSKEAKLEKSRKAREVTKKYKAIVDATKEQKVNSIIQN